MKSLTNSDPDIQFAIGDIVKIFIEDEEDLKLLQDGHGGYVSEIKNVLTRQIISYLQHFNDFFI